MERLREAQLALLDLLKVFKTICEAEGIPYFLMGGTLLGAVRHGGFIPWDDDIDVALFRPDYDRFLETGRRYLPDGVAFAHYTLDPAYPDYTMKLVNRHVTYVIERQTTHARQNAWIDIFPLDGAPGTPVGRFLQFRRLDYHRMLCSFHDIADVRIDPERSLWKRALVAFAQRVPVGRLVNPSAEKRAIDRVFRACPTETASLFGIYMGAYHGREVYPKAWFERGRSMEFEGESYQVPAGAEAYLQHLYGDYTRLPPPEQRVPKHHILDIEFGGV